jgi:hypothetical protein
VSVQIAIMKVLASYPDGCASLAAMKSDLAFLAGAGPEWGQRLKRLAVKAPGLDIFSQRLVLKDEMGWKLTAAGRAMLRYIETPTLMKSAIQIGTLTQIQTQARMRISADAVVVPANDDSDWRRRPYY